MSGDMGEDRERSGDSRGGPARVGGPKGRSKTGQKELGEVRNDLGDPRGGPERIEGCGGDPGRVGGP